MAKILNLNLEIVSQQKFASFQVVLETSSRHVLKNSWRRLQCNNFSSSKMFSRPFQDVFNKYCKRPSRCLHVSTMSRKMKNCYAEDAFKTSSTSPRHALKTSPRHALNTFGDKQNIYWEEIIYLCLPNLNLHLKNLYLVNLYLAILRQIQSKSRMH